MKYSSAATLGFVSCALALPTGFGEKPFPFPMPTGLAKLGDELPKPSGTEAPTKPSGMPGSGSGMPDIIKDFAEMFTGGSQQQEKRDVPFPMPSAVKNLADELPKPSGLPNLDMKKIAEMFTGGSQQQEKRDVPFPMPSAIKNLADELPKPSGLPNLDMKKIAEMFTGQQEKRGLPFENPFADAIPTPFSSSASELPKLSGSDGPKPTGLPVPNGLPMPFLPPAFAEGEKLPKPSGSALPTPPSSSDAPTPTAPAVVPFFA